MLVYSQVRRQRRRFVALTGLTPSEFRSLLSAFTKVYEGRYPIDYTLSGQPRRRFAGGGGRGVLSSPEQKMLFILVYLKTYHLQVLMGQLFGLSQRSVNEWIHRLLPVLRIALD